MKLGVYFIVILTFLTACNDASKKTQLPDNQADIYLPKSNGQINSVAVVIDDALWKGAVGDSIRKYFASPIDGLPTEEPTFSLHQIPVEIFTENTRNSRNILLIKKDSVSEVFIQKNKYAKPQQVAVIKGKTNRDIVCQIQEKYAKITAIFKENDILENQSRFHKSLSEDKQVEERLKIRFTMPSLYKVVKKEHNFFWIERPIKGGTSNLILYEMPLKNTHFTTEEIIKMRDSIGKRYIPGREEGMYMVTEKAFAPSVFKTTIKNRKTIESRGLWEVKNFMLGGPFINFMIEDTANNRFLVAEGFVSAPMTEKRDFLSELEAIIKSVEFL